MLLILYLVLACVLATMSETTDRASCPDKFEANETSAMDQFLCRVSQHNKDTLGTLIGNGFIDPGNGLKMATLNLTAYTLQVNRIISDNKQWVISSLVKHKSSAANSGSNLTDLQNIVNQISTPDSCGNVACHTIRIPTHVLYGTAGTTNDRRFRNYAEEIRDTFAQFNDSIVRNNVNINSKVKTLSDKIGHPYNNNTIFDCATGNFANGGGTLSDCLKEIEFRISKDETTLNVVKDSLNSAMKAIHPPVSDFPSVISVLNTRVNTALQTNTTLFSWNIIDQPTVLIASTSDFSSRLNNELEIMFNTTRIKLEQQGISDKIDLLSALDTKVTIPKLDYLNVQIPSQEVSAFVSELANVTQNRFNGLKNNLNDGKIMISAYSGFDHHPNSLSLIDYTEATNSRLLVLESTNSLKNYVTFADLKSEMKTIPNQVMHLPNPAESGPGTIDVNLQGLTAIIGGEFTLVRKAMIFLHQLITNETGPGNTTYHSFPDQISSAIVPLPQLFTKPERQPYQRDILIHMDNTTVLNFTIDVQQKFRQSDALHLKLILDADNMKDNLTVQSQEIMEGIKGRQVIREELIFVETILRNVSTTVKVIQKELKESRKQIHDKSELDDVVDKLGGTNAVIGILASLITIMLGCVTVFAACRKFTHHTEIKIKTHNTSTYIKRHGGILKNYETPGKMYGSVKLEFIPTTLHHYETGIKDLENGVDTVYICGIYSFLTPSPKMKQDQRNSPVQRDMLCGETGDTRAYLPLGFFPNLEQAESLRMVMDMVIQSQSANITINTAVSGLSLFIPIDGDAFFKERTAITPRKDLSKSLHLDRVGGILSGLEHLGHQINQDLRPFSGVKWFPFNGICIPEMSSYFLGNPALDAIMLYCNGEIMVNVPAPRMMIKAPSRGVLLNDVLTMQDLMGHGSGCGCPKCQTLLSVILTLNDFIEISHTSAWYKRYILTVKGMMEENERGAEMIAAMRNEAGLSREPSVIEALNRASADPQFVKRTRSKGSVYVPVIQEDWRTRNFVLEPIDPLLESVSMKDLIPDVSFPEQVNILRSVAGIHMKTGRRPKKISGKEIAKEYLSIMKEEKARGTDVDKADEYRKRMMISSQVDDVTKEMKGYKKAVKTAVKGNWVPGDYSAA